MTELEVFERSLEVSRLTLYVSIALSLVSIVFTILSMAFQRSHNKKSVKPLCDLRVEDGEGLAIGLWNLGLGPMIVKWIRVENPDGKGWSELSEALKDGPDSLRLALLCDDAIIPPEGSLPLVECSGKGKAGAAFVKKTLGGKRLSIGYEDIYERRLHTEAVVRFRD